MKNKTASEAELAIKFINHFEGCDIYPEVNCPGGGIVDIVAKIGKVIIAIEVKNSFNTTVIHQAFRNFCFSNLSYVAVPRPSRGSHFRNTPAETICEELGIGVLYYDDMNSANPKILRFIRSKLGDDYQPSHIFEQVSPAYRRATKSITLHDWMKRSEAGSKNNRLTYFKITVEEITDVITRNGGKIEIDRVFNDKKFHYSTPKGARIGILDMISRGVITSFKQEGKFLVINNEEKLHTKWLTPEAIDKMKIYNPMKDAKIINIK